MGSAPRRAQTDQALPEAAPITFQPDQPTAQTRRPQSQGATHWSDLENGEKNREATCQVQRRDAFRASLGFAEQ